MHKTSLVNEHSATCTQRMIHVKFYIIGTRLVGTWYITWHTFMEMREKQQSVWISDLHYDARPRRTKVCPCVLLHKHKFRSTSLSTLNIPALSVQSSVSASPLDFTTTTISLDWTWDCLGQILKPGRLIKWCFSQRFQVFNETQTNKHLMDATCERAHG